MSIIGFDASDVRQPLYSYTFLMLEVHEEHWYMPKVRIKKKCQNQLPRRVSKLLTGQYLPVQGLRLF